MKKNVELEFINKVKELDKSMQDLADFCNKNEKELAATDVSNYYPFNLSFDELASETYCWLSALVNNYCAKRSK